MPNWCSTNYVIKGVPSEIRKIRDILKTLEEFESPVENDFGKLWLGNLLCLAGENPLESEVRCRGAITYVDDTEEDELILDVETAWAPMNRVIKDYLVKDAGVEITIWSEEPGVGYYASSKKENIGKYHLSFEADGSYYSSEEGEDIEGIYALLKKVLGDMISIEGEITEDNVVDALRKLEEEEKIEWYAIHEIQEIDFSEDC